MKPIVPLVLAMISSGLAWGALDRDGNGLSDVAEWIYFRGPTDPNADPDGDGDSTASELIWGSDPTLAVSKVIGASATVVGSELFLTWPAVGGKVYRLQFSFDLVEWETAAEGRLALYREPLGESLKFWRVQVLVITPDSDGNGLDDWEEELWRSKYGALPSKTDLDGDGLPDADEFAQGRDPEKKDHPAVGLIVFTPLEK